MKQADTDGNEFHLTSDTTDVRHRRSQLQRLMNQTQRSSLLTQPT